MKVDHKRGNLMEFDHKRGMEFDGIWHANKRHELVHDCHLHGTKLEKRH